MTKELLFFKRKLVLTEKDSVEEIAAKVHELEHRYFPELLHNF